MRVTLTAPDTKKKYKIEPLDNGLCYQLFVSPMPGAVNKKTGKPVKSDWIFSGAYPSTIEHGVEIAVHKMLADPNGNADIECDPKHLTKTIKKTMEDYINKVVASVEVEMTEAEEKVLGALTEVLGKDE